MLAYPDTTDLVLKKRKGFVRIAIETGAALVPIFVFGENDLYYQVYALWASELTIMLLFGTMFIVSGSKTYV